MKEREKKEWGLTALFCVNGRVVQLHGGSRPCGMEEREREK